uniref:Kinetochore associated 1 n=1 Tax=Myripristis murdjan TaxID=586833 RepID=A0A667ZTG4_9TELE
MWNDVELLLNEDTNSGFSSVSREENGSGLYQVDTLVKISAAQRVQSGPHLSSSSGSNWSVVVADRTVILFDQTYQSILLHLDFEANVDAVDVCLEGQFLVVCERSGNLNLIYVPHKRILLTRVRLVFRLHVPRIKLNLDFSVFFLCSQDVLSLWDLHFLVMICCWPDLAIHDFQLTAECSSTSMAAFVSTLQVRDLPSMAVCYSLEVSSVACLVQTRISMDTIYLVEGIAENTDSPAEPVSCVVVRCFTEALPENRLSRLLHKHMFDEAEKFAKTFELDLELVYKVKLDFVLEQLASASVGGYGQDVWSEIVEEARTNLMKISDQQYVVEYCLKAPWPTFETAERMLNHAASKYSSLHIQEALARLATFCSLHGLEKFNGIAWIEFLNSTDHIGDILTQLRERDLKGAQLLWLRHEGQVAGEFDESRLEALLSAIPEDLPSQDLCPWFRTIIVPFVRRVLPRGQKILARWLEQRARNLELTEKGAWPQNGLDLAELGLPTSWTWMKSDDNFGAVEIEDLKSLASNLRQLLDLHKKYNCRLSLSVFEKGSVRSVAFFMLDKVPAPELVSATVESSVLPYATEHQIPCDELLLQYIKDLLERCSSQTSTLFTEWEAKALAVLNCMTDTDIKVDAVLEIMQKAVVPWSDVVEKLVQQYLEMEGPKQNLLKESYHLMEIRKLLRGYGIRNFNLSNNTQVMTLIRYILKQDFPMSLEDSLKLADAYKLPTTQINYLYLIQLIGQGKVSCMTVLKKLSSAEAECVIERLTTWARLQLEDKDHLSEEVRRGEMTGPYIKKKNNDALKSMECETSLIMFKTIAHLQEDFDIFFTPSNYEDPKVRKQIQEHHITAYENTRGCCPPKGKTTAVPVVANDPDGKTKTISTEAGLRRLGRQLQRSEQELWSDLALRALRVGKVDKALKILRSLYEHHCNPSTGKVLFTAAQTLCQMLEADVPMVLPDEMDLPGVIHNLACQAVTVCHSDLLLDCLELCKCTRTAMDVYHQCQLSDNYGFITKDLTLEAEKDPYSQGSFQDVFNEDCIVLDPVSVLPVQYEITNSLLPVSQDTKLYPLDCSCLPHCSFEDGTNHLKPLLGPLTNMLQMLQECSQLELALRVLVNSFGACLQHVTSNIMDLKLSTQLRKTTTSSLNTVVFNWRVVDCDLAIGLCTLLSKPEVFKILWKVIDNTWKNYDKILAVARIGAHLCSLYKEEEEQQKFHSVITDAEWGIKLGKLGISIQSVFRQCPEMKSNLIPVLVKNKNITPDIILQYCSTFGLDRDNVINQYITTLLLQEDEEGAGEAGDAAADQEDVQPLSHADALERILQIIPMLHSTSNLTDSLSSAVLKLSPYNYERIEVALKIIQTADENIPNFSAMALLQHLKSYKRISPPSDVEGIYLMDNGLQPTPASNSRLPFHLLMQTNHYWKIISPELSEETFPTLLLISKLMKVNLDKLYMLAAKQVFEKSMKPLLLEENKKGQKHFSNKETFKVAKTMMEYIHFIQSPEWAAATAHKITQELPPGVVKSQSLRFCLALGEAWLKDPNLEVSQEAARARGETFLSKLKLQFQHSATENALTAGGLNSPELLKLTGLPARLIVALYEHSSVEQRYKDSGGQTYPGEYNTSVRLLCFVLVVYLLQPCPGDVAARLLSPILSPLSSSGPRLTFCHRSRALLCLIRLADAATLEAQTQIPRTKIKYYLKCYIYVSRLEALNIPCTVESFLDRPKEGMVKGLWKNHSHEPQAVRLVADLCLEYQVYDPQLWNGLLQKLLSFNMVRRDGPASISSFSRTWRSMILAPFVTGKTCPFLLNLDLIGIANRFAQFNLPAFALGTLLLIPCASKKAQQIQAFLSLCNPVAILEQVDELMSTGELAGVPSQFPDRLSKCICRVCSILYYFSSSCSSPFDLPHSEDEANSLAREYMKRREHQRGKPLLVGSPSPGSLKVRILCDYTVYKIRCHFIVRLPL